MFPEELLIFQIKARKSGRIYYQQNLSQADISILIEECKMETFCSISWTREDIRTLLEDHGKDCSEESINRFLDQLDVRYFEEMCIQDGWERLSSLV